MTKVLLALLCLMVPVLAAAQVKGGAPVFVLDLLDERERYVVVKASTFNEALAKKPSEPHAPTALERVVDACRSEDPDKMKPVVDDVHKCMDCLAAYQEKRFITERNDQVLLVVLFDASQIAPDLLYAHFEETRRDSELIATAKAMKAIVLEAGQAPRCKVFAYMLQHKRSRFRVNVPIPAARPAAMSPAAPSSSLFTGSRPAASATSSAAATKDVRSPEVILGPREQWFMSADFSISKASVKLGKTPTPGAEELKAKDFFVALNFAASDLLADRDSPLQRRNILHELVFKLQVTPSREPWSAWAFGAGVRGYRAKTILWNMDIVHPYVTFGRQSDENNQVHWRAAFGLGFDPRAINREE